MLSTVKRFILFRILVIGRSKQHDIDMLCYNIKEKWKEKTHGLQGLCV